MDSDVADHCCRFSLSDGTHDFSDNCDHCHAATCKACEELERTLENLLDIAKAIQYDNEDQKDDTLYIVTEVRKTGISDRNTNRAITFQKHCFYWILKFILISTKICYGKLFLQCNL